MARAYADGSRQRKGRAPLDCRSAGRIGSHRRDGAAIFPDRHGRGVELGDGQGHRFRSAVERRAAGRHQDLTARSGDRIPLRAPTRSPALFGARLSGLRSLPGETALLAATPILALLLPAHRRLILMSPRTTSIGAAAFELPRRE